MAAEYNIFLLWSKARFKEQEVTDLISEKFEIVKTYEIFWSRKFFLQNLSRFYGKKLPSARSKLKLCGEGSFLVLLVKDSSPLIADNGRNQNMSVMKYNLRQLLGGNYLHASDTQKEAEENLYLLFGKSLRRLLIEPTFKKVRVVKQDLIGTPTWLDEDKLAKVVKKLPNAEFDKENRTIICSDVLLAQRLLNARKVVWTWHKNRYKISIRGWNEIFTIKKI